MKQTLRIFHTVSNAQRGGLERRVCNECVWMAEQGHRFALAPQHPRQPSKGEADFPLENLLGARPGMSS